jgi:hypothetical protein
VGRVAYFVKAILRSEGAKEAARRLGLPGQPQRFAIVDAFVADDVQSALRNVSLRDPPVAAVANAMVKAKLVKEPQAYLGLLSKVQAGATVLAVGQQSEAHLSIPGAPEAGTLQSLAVPLSSNFATWYQETANWAVAPICRIDPRLSKLQMQVGSGPMQSAVNRITATKMYFVHTYSKSNSKALQRR